MPKTVSGKELVRFLAKKGFQVYSQKGSHVKLISTERNTKTIVPLHKEISIGTMRAIIKQAQLTEKETSKLLNE